MEKLQDFYQPSLTISNNGKLCKKRGGFVIRIKQEQLIVIFLIVFVIGGGLGYVLEGRIGRKDEKIVINQGSNQSNTEKIDKVHNKHDKMENSTTKEETIIVHVTGGVKNSGVYELSEKSRVVDALQAAGGQTEKADLNQINLAAPIFDGDRVLIPVIGMADSGSTLDSYSNSGNIYSPKLSKTKERININRAGNEELQKLSGIGPSKAESIIKYREEIGRFTKAEELLNVSGIGAKTLEKIKDKLVFR